jgi:hypothetical protein
MTEKVVKVKKGLRRTKYQLPNLKIAELFRAGISNFSGAQKSISRNQFRQSM